MYKGRVILSNMGGTYTQDGQLCATHSITIANLY